MQVSVGGAKPFSHRGRQVQEMTFKSFCWAMGGGSAGTFLGLIGADVAQANNYPPWVGAAIAGGCGVVIALVNLYAKLRQIRHDREQRARSNP